MVPQSSSPCLHQFLRHVNAVHTRNLFLHNSHYNMNVQLTPPSRGSGRGSISRRTSVLAASGHLRTVPSTEYVIQSFLFSCHFGLQKTVAQRDLRRSPCEVPCCLLCDFNKIRKGSTNSTELRTTTFQRIRSAILHLLRCSLSDTANITDV